MPPVRPSRMRLPLIVVIGRVAEALGVDGHSRVNRETMPISDWALAARPRERLLALGPEHLSDAELIAVCLRTGTSGKSAIDLARELIQRFGGLHGLLGAERSSVVAVQ